MRYIDGKVKNPLIMQGTISPILRLSVYHTAWLHVPDLALLCLFSSKKGPRVVLCKGFVCALPFARHTVPASGHSPNSYSS